MPTIALMIPNRGAIVTSLLLICSVSRSSAQNQAASEERPAPPKNSRIKEGGVNISDQAGKLVIEIGGQPFAEYQYQGVAKPYLYPILGPGGERMTREWPMKNVPGEEHDHPHHRSLWYAHGDINGQDFWSETEKSGKTVHQNFTQIESGPEVGFFKESVKLVGQDGHVVGSDERTFRFYNRTNQRLFDFEITIRATETNLVFGDTKEGTMAIRLAESMRLTGPKNKPGAGHILNSEGVRDA